jgi:hypothetical protein
LFLPWLIDQLLFLTLYPSLTALSDMARRCSELEEKCLQHQANSTRRYSDLEEKYSQGQINLTQVSASLDDVRSLNSSLNAQLDSERAAHEVSYLIGSIVLTVCWMLES